MATLVLPLRRRRDMVPAAAVIGIIRDFAAMADNPPLGCFHWLTRIERYMHELVDIGAGAATEA